MEKKKASNGQEYKPVGFEMLTEILRLHNLYVHEDGEGVCADLSGADLSGANLSGADLRYANLSGAKGLVSASDFILANFEKTDEGYIAYKTFNSVFTPPGSWEIKEGSVISENVNFDRTYDCGCGINIAPLDWVRKYNNGTVWRVLIRFEWLAGVCVPYHSDGKVRCERVQLLEVIE